MCHPHSPCMVVIKPRLGSSEQLQLCRSEVCWVSCFLFFEYHRARVKVSAGLGPGGETVPGGSGRWHSCISYGCRTGVSFPCWRLDGCCSQLLGTTLARDSWCLHSKASDHFRSLLPLLLHLPDVSPDDSIGPTQIIQDYFHISSSVPLNASSESLCQIA